MKQKDATSMIDRMNYWKPEGENVFVGDCASSQYRPRSLGGASHRLIRSHNVLDLEINGNRTCMIPHYEYPDSMISFYVQNGHAEWKNFQVYSW